MTVCVIGCCKMWETPHCWWSLSFPWQAIYQFSGQKNPYYCNIYNIYAQQIVTSGWTIVHVTQWKNPNMFMFNWEAASPVLIINCNCANCRQSYLFICINVLKHLHFLFLQNNEKFKCVVNRCTAVCTSFENCANVIEKNGTIVTSEIGWRMCFMHTSWGCVTPLVNNTKRSDGSMMVLLQNPRTFVMCRYIVRLGVIQCSGHSVK